jgi:hypothetical protein
MLYMHFCVCYITVLVIDKYTMELMQDWWKCSLAEEINSSLLIKETKLPPFCLKSPQLASRRCLVDWLAVLCDNYRVCRTARHLAITLLDYFMDRYVIVEEKLKLVGIGCLLVAGQIISKLTFRYKMAAKLITVVPVLYEQNGWSY